MMEREKAVVLLLTCLIFLFEIQATDIGVTSSDGKIRYKYVGCYRDHGLNRTLPWHYFNAKKYVNWHKEEDYNFKEVIDMCAVHAHSRSDLSFFGVQFFGECWGGGVDAFYNRFGKSKDCLEFPGVPGVGKSWTNAVYKIVFECEVNGVRYRDGESFYIPQNPINFNDIGCRNCSCDRGLKNCNRNIKCHFFFSCHKFIPASQGQCCPTCDSDSDLDKEQRNANHRGAEEGDSASVSTGSPVHRSDNHCIITTTAKINMDDNYSFYDQCYTITILT